MVTLVYDLLRHFLPPLHIFTLLHFLRLFCHTLHAAHTYMHFAHTLHLYARIKLHPFAFYAFSHISTFPIPFTHSIYVCAFGPDVCLLYSYSCIYPTTDATFSLLALARARVTHTYMHTKRHNFTTLPTTTYNSLHTTSLYVYNAFLSFYICMVDGVDDR